MAITFTSWESCTDETGASHTLDWSSPEAMAGKPGWMYFEAIRQAVNERAKVQQVGGTLWYDPVTAWLGVEWPGSFTGNGGGYFPYGPAISGMSSTWPLGTGFAPVVDRAISTRMFVPWAYRYSPYYIYEYTQWVDYTDSSGNWDNVAKTSIPTIDSIADAEAILGVSWIPYSSASSWPEWLYNKYLFLNLMRWTRNNPMPFYPSRLTATKTRYGKSAGDPSFAVAEAAFNAASFGTSPWWSDPGAMSSSATAYESWGAISILKEYQSVTISGFTSAHNHQLCAYGRFLTNGTDVPGDYPTYAYGDCILVYESSVDASTQRTFTWGNDSGINACLDPVVYGSANRHYTLQQPQYGGLVVKFDVTGGFTFVAPAA